MLPLVEEAIQASQNREPPETVAMELLHQKAQLWIAFDDKIRGMVITRILMTDSERILNIQYAAGTRGMKWIPQALKIFESYGRDCKCSVIESNGIPKWEAMAKRLKMVEIARIYRKQL